MHETPFMAKVAIVSMMVTCAQSHRTESTQVLSKIIHLLVSSAIFHAAVHGAMRTIGELR